MMSSDVSWNQGIAQGYASLLFYESEMLKNFEREIPFQIGNETV